ncbi:PQQ-dependent sugar dehydrogenase [Catellatospora bangladeshensis]|uniref:PQQ-dependent sugar dehydrogenase n=1 Tax=Catellatospora bangladeshensis TaxID=310355 RepID=UPI001940BD33|nr:PQQ-dependent sugar dehydrogenase [Catellatospora bangladeshensis]
MNSDFRVGAFGTALLSGVLMFATAAAPAPSAARAAAPSAPVITEPEKDNRVLSAADVHMETRPLQGNDGGDVHLCTDWEIWAGSPGGGERVWFDSCASGTGRVHVHLGDGVFENSFAGRADLLPDRQYTLRVRHRDTSGGWTAYSARPFKTDVERKPLPGEGDWKVHQPGFVVEEVAEDFALPVNIAMVPNHPSDPAKPLFYVTELYGKIITVTGDFKKKTYAKDLLDFDPSAQFPGTGEMGLTGIVVEPKTGDVIAAMLYKDDGDLLAKIVRFQSTDGGFTAAKQNTIIKFPGEEQSTSHQISNLTIGPDGKLYVHMGDGFVADTAEDMDSFRGKVLRMNLDGTAPSDNPFYKGTGKFQARDYIWAYGLRNPFGGAWRTADGQHYSVENGPSVNDRLARITKGGRYHWTGGASGLTKNALYNWKETQGPVNIAFTEPEVYHAAGFPQEKYGNAFVTLSGPTYATGPQRRGKKIVEFEFDKDGSVDDPKTLIEYTGSGKTSVAALAPGPDGLYFSTLYTKIGDATDSGAKILRVRYAPKGTSSPVTLYSDSGFKGESRGLGTGIFDAAAGAFGKLKDNTASSLKVAGGYRVVACDGPAAAPSLGTCRYFGAGSHGSLAEFNDKISSLAVFGGPVEGRGVVGYRETNLKGASQPLGAGMHESVAGELAGGDSTPISSLKIGAGYRLIACDRDRAGSADLGVCRILGSGEHATLGELNGKVSLLGVVGPPVTVFSEPKAKGKAQSLEGGVYEGRQKELAEVGDDTISSLRVEPGYRVVACANDGGTGGGTGNLGRCRAFPAGEHTLTGTDLDDAISLLLVSGETAKGAGVTAYTDRDFKGGKSALGPGLYEDTQGGLGDAGNDDISSLKVAAGHRAVACEHGTKPAVFDVGLCRYYAAGDYAYLGADLNDLITLVAVDTVTAGPNKG